MINIQPDLLRRYPWFGRTAGLRLGHCKPEIEHYVDLERYDYVLYLDSDILVTTNRLVALVETLCRESHFVVQRDNVSVMSGASFAGGWC